MLKTDHKFSIINVPILKTEDEKELESNIRRFKHINISKLRPNNEVCKDIISEVTKNQEIDSILYKLTKIDFENGLMGRIDLTPDPSKPPPRVGSKSRKKSEGTSPRITSPGTSSSPYTPFTELEDIYEDQGDSTKSRSKNLKKSPNKGKSTKRGKGSEEDMVIEQIDVALLNTGHSLRSNTITASKLPVEGVGHGMEQLEIEGIDNKRDRKLDNKRDKRHRKLDRKLEKKGNKLHQNHDDNYNATEVMSIASSKDDPPIQHGQCTCCSII